MFGKYRRLKANNSQEKDKSIPMVFYHFKRDYSCLEVKAYSSISELYRQIIDSVNKRKEKWPIFIDDKQKGAAVKGKLLEYKKEYAKEHGWSLFLNGGSEESAEGKKERISKAKAQAKRILAVNANSKDDETQRKEQKNHSGQKYLEYQLSWFGKTYHSEDDPTFVDNVIENKPLVAFLEAYADSGEAIEGKEKMAEFQTEFKRLHDAVYPSVVKDKTHLYGYKVMNGTLKNRSLGYEITGQTQRGPWKVIK